MFFAFPTTFGPTSISPQHRSLGEQCPGYRTTLSCMQLARCSPPSVHTSIDSRTKPEVSADVVRARTRTQSKAAAAAPADNAAVISTVGTALSSVNNAVYEGANESINIVSRSSLDGTSSVSRTQPHKTGSAAPLYGSTSTAALIS